MVLENERRNLQIVSNSLYFYLFSGTFYCFSVEDKSVGFLFVIVERNKVCFSFEMSKNFPKFAANN